MTILRPVAHTVYRLLFPCRAIDNRYAHIPKGQPMIVACNHPGHHDPIIILSHLNRNPHFLAKAELFDGPFGWFFKHLGLIRVNRDKHGSGLKVAEQALKDNHVVAIFPEGTTKFKEINQLLPFKYGAVKLAMATGTPILPVAIIGRPRPLWFGRSKVKFGKPYTIPANATIDQSNHELEQKILKMMRQAGMKDAELLPGKPASNPSKQPPKSD